VQDDVRERVFEYVEYQWNANRCLDRNSFLMNLSAPLRSEILFLTYGKSLHKVRVRGGGTTFGC
jgi:hypothetical protein